VPCGRPPPRVAGLCRHDRRPGAQSYRTKRESVDSGELGEDGEKIASSCIGRLFVH
jgi:hypothetical protein